MKSWASMKRWKMMELTGKIHPQMKMMMNRLRKGLDRSGVKGITLLILISLLLHSTPEDPRGPQLADRTRQDAMLQFGKEEDFFSLFFASPLVQKLCDFTNAYAQEHIADNPSYQNRQRLGFDICPWNVWFYCPLDFYGLRAVTSPRVLLVLCIIAQWQLGSSYDFLQGQV